MWRLNNTLLSGSKNTVKKNLKNLETNENEDTTIQNLWDTTKTIFREKFIVI